jgi:hypothetical protein
MYYSININQIAIARHNKKYNTNFDLVDGAILEYLQKQSTSAFAKRNYKIFDGLVFYLLFYDNIIQQLPLIKIENRESIGRRIKKLADANVILQKVEKIPNNGTKIYFTTTNTFETFFSYDTTQKSDGDTTQKSDGDTTQKSDELIYDKNIKNKNINDNTNPASGSPSQRDISEIPNSPDTKEFLATQKQDGKQDYILNTSKKEGSSKNGILGEKLLNNSMNTKVERVAQGGAQKEKFELKTKQEVQQFVTNFKAHAIIVNGVPKTAPIFSQNEIDLITEYILRRKESYKSKVKSTPKALTGVLNDILQAREQIPLEIIFKQDEGVYVHCGTKGDKTKPYQTITLEYFKTLIQKTTFNKQDAKPTLRETIDTNRNAIKSIDVSKYF